MNMFTATIAAVLFGIVVGGICYLCADIQYKKMEQRHALLKTQVRLEKQHYAMLEKQLEQNAACLAEIEKQIEFMDSCLQSRSDTLLLEYRQELLETRQKLCMEKYCTNPILNSVIHHKKAECREKGIALTLNLSSFQCEFIKEVDMVGILYNLFDNAIESCCHVENRKERYLTVTCENRKTETILEFVNSRNPSFDIGSQQKTWKKDAENHGFGLQIMDKLVKKYQGTVSFEKFPDCYRVWISFPCAESVFI